MSIDPVTEHVYYVEYELYVSQWHDPRQQGPSPLVILPPVDVLANLLDLVPATVVW